MKDNNKEITRLIKQMQNGSKSAFEEFYKLTSPKAYFTALKITQNEQDAEDILQESYIKALEKINEIDTTQNINSWFLKIVANKSKNLLKSRNHFVFEGEEEKIFEDLPEETVEFSPEENLDQEELRLEVMAAIDELTDEKRACIMMMYFGDMSVKEIAESIEVPESTVKNRLFTARKDLKAKFEKNGNILYGAALGGLLIWALTKTGETTAAAFAAGSASSAILAGVNSSAVSTAASTAVTSATAVSTVSSAAATGTGVAAKVAALSVAQKIVAGVAATAVIGGSTAGVATVAKKIASTNETTTYIEEVTTAPSQTEEYAFAIIPEESSTTLPLSTEQITEPTATVQSKTTTKRSSATSTAAATTKTTAVTSTTKRTTTTEPTTTRRATTTKRATTTTRPATTTTRPTTTTEPTTERETTTRVTTTRPTTTQPTTTQPTTTQPTTTQPTTQAPATVNVEVVDMDETVVATFSFTVEADTEMTWEYLVTQIKNKGYEPKAGVYGDAVGAVAQSGRSYSVTAEL